MAKDSKPAGGAKKKAKSAKLGEGVKLKLKVQDKKAGKRRGKASKQGGSGQSPLEALARLAESPLVADLIAAGATAAVAALAERGLSGTRKGNAAKNAGKAAAAAIGARLMSEFKAMKDAANNDPAKDESGKA